MKPMSKKIQTVIQVAFKAVRICNVTPSTLTGIEKYTGASRYDVKNVVDNLVELGALQVKGTVHGRGKPANLYEYNRFYKW